MRLSAQDFELARRAESRDPQAIKELLERCRCVPRILTGLNRRSAAKLGQEQLADLTQQTLLVVWQRLSTYAGTGPLESWLFMIARNTYFAAKRAAQRAPRQQREQVLELPDTAELERKESEATREEVGVALEKLGADHRHILVLRGFEARGFEQIAEDLGISISAAKQRYYRALAELRRLLQAGDRHRAQKPITRLP